MILADTSAWVEFLRGSNAAAGLELKRLLAQDADVAVTEIIVMEILAGARSAQHLRELRSRIIAFPILTLEGLADFEEAALVYRACRAEGETVRSLTDCLIAVPAIRAGAALLHSDADFDAIARHTALRIHPLPSRR
jgi:predicted nucleic acid-binding protein